MTWWWLSFANPYLPAGSQFLGACLVKAHGVAEAVRVAHVLEINPGGEVQFMKLLPTAPIPAKWAERLLTRAECAQFDEEMILQQNQEF